MWRRILVLVLLAAVLGSAIFILFFRTGGSGIPGNALRALPVSSALILEIQRPSENWAKLAGDNALWNALGQSETFRDLHQTIQELDSFQQATGPLKEFLQAQPLYVAAHTTGALDYDWIFALGIPERFDGEQVRETILQYAGAGSTVDTKNFQDVQLYLLTTADQQKFSFVVHQGVFLGSRSTLLLEQALRQMASGSSLLEDQAFKTVRSTAGNEQEVQAYVHYANFSRVVSTFLSSESKAAVYPLAELAGWAELDLNITNNSVHLNGFSSNPDSVAHYLDIFSAQEPQAIGVPGIVPARTAVLVHLGISNFRQFYHDRLAYYDQSNLPHDYRQYVEQLQAHCDCDPEEKLLTWVQQEVALVIPEPASPQAPITSLLVLKAQDVDRAVESLTSLYRGPADSLLVENYRGFPIRKLGFRGPYRPFLGEVFGNPEHTHYTVIRNYMVFANGPRQLHRFINDYLKERTLSKDPHYHVYAENISGESNVFIYSNVGRSPDVYRHFVTEEYQQDIDLRKELFRQFESAAIQISREREGLFYQSISLKHNPVYQPDQAARWEIQLDTGILQRPNLVRNHYTKAYELAVQDAANALYLIDNSGTIQWKRSLENRIISDIRQIDVFGNDKLQLLFNTRTHLYCIDRLGRDVEGFPVKLPAPASAPVTILDYDGKHHYRLLVPCKDGMVRNYNKQGKPVKGWSFQAMKAPVNRAVQHHVLGEKDYLIAVDRDGRVRITDRKGEERIAVKAKLPLAPGQPFFISPAEEASAIRIIGTDTLGQVIGLDFGGEAHLETFDTLAGNHYFDHRDVNGDGNPDYLFATATQVRAYDAEHNRILDIVPDSVIVGAPAYFASPDGGDFFVAIRTGSNDEIWVYDRQGNLRNDTPYTGSTPLTLDDLDQNRQPDLIVGDRGNFIHAFRID